ncbi:hypothetical protein PRZ48_007152 [Zasmidium cellare]|uniref:Methyltransferase type 11 domain-containing protein n=1 Tax=Zasmidium cellare TaxID=395010 RepID=A0ABR0EIZ2_ZASCE|nr:hypothetical protein PRZ48_007152 [Zasmidium cellare]
MATAGEKWSAGATKYDHRVAKVTGDGGEALIKLVDKIKPFDNNSKVFEAGAGTGATTELLRKKNDHMAIVAVDPAAGMLEQLKKRDIKNIEVLQIEATEDHVSRGLQAGSFSHALSNFVLQFVVPRAQIAVNEMFNLLQSGGIIGNTMWTNASVGEPWNIACKNLDPNFERVTSAFSDALRVGEDLERLYKAAGFVDVHSEEFELLFKFPSAEDYAEYFLHAQNPPFVAMQSSWKGKPEDVKDELVRVAKEQYNDGKFKMVMASVVGRKP